MEKEYISLNHLGWLRDLLYNKDYAEHFLIYNLDDKSIVSERLSKMTDKQYGYFLALKVNNNWFKIKNLLDNFLTHK